MRTGSMRVAEISTYAIRQNVAHLRALTGGNVIVVAKAGGYGHGALIAAEAAMAGGAVMVGVADLEEALALRDQGFTHPLLCWLHGPRTDFVAAVAEEIELGVSSQCQLDAIRMLHAKPANARVCISRLIQG